MAIDGHSPDRDIFGTRRFTVAGETVAREIVHGIEHMGGDDHPYMQDARAGFRLRDTVVRGGIFLLGDNRLPHVYDSRAFGPVNPSTCVGHVFMRWKTNPSRPDFDHAILDTID
jgi:type IV secretory pathway protease TraF